MKWPLSMSFAKLISRTSDAGSARYTLKAPGELNPDREYYWHVRAKDAQGVWGPWSKTWRFTPRGPRSIWSERNRAHVARLTAAGRMRPAGLSEVERDFLAALVKSREVDDLPGQFALACAKIARHAGLMRGAKAFGHQHRQVVEPAVVRAAVAERKRCGLSFKQQAR